MCINHLKNYRSLLEYCSEGNIELISNLISKENINGLTNFDNELHRSDKHTPLEVSILSLKYDVLEYLLAQGANPNLLIDVSNHGMCDYDEPQERVYKYSTYLHYAIFKEVEDFEFQNSDILFGNTKIKEMYIPIEALKILYKYGADINKMNEKGETPLDMAICKSHHTAEEYLKSIGAKTSKEIEENNKSSS